MPPNTTFEGTRDQGGRAVLALDDAVEAWGIAIAIIFVILSRWAPLEWEWPFGIIGAASAILSIAAWFKKKLERIRKWRL
jgi:hypothetical protein